MLKEWEREAEEKFRKVLEVQATTPELDMQGNPPPYAPLGRREEIDPPPLPGIAPMANVMEG